MITRDNIIDELVYYFQDKRYYLLVCDCGFAKIDRLQALCPSRVINCGVMEQATVGIAAGMAQAGLKPIIYSIAKFVVYRALEQIRDDVVNMGRDVKIIGNGSGDFFKDLGLCHWVKNDDVKLMDVIGMRTYTGAEFDEWITSRQAGYIQC